MAINLQAVNKEESPQLWDIHQEIDGCTKCGLCEDNTFYVPGMGTEKTDVMFIGEGPGKKEDELGLPFVGASGKFLDLMLAEIGLDRKHIYIANIVKCRPPNNRDPEPSEIEACTEYLDAQIAAIDPKIIVTLGRFSMAKFLPGVKISEVHGKPKRRESDSRIIFPSYHPAVALYNGGMRETLMEDFRKIPKILALIPE